MIGACAEHAKVKIGKNIVKDMLREVASPKPDRESEIADDPLSPAGWAMC